MAERHPDDGGAQPVPESSETKEHWFDETWTRVHPLSPLVQGWAIFIGLPVIVLGYNWQAWQGLWEALRSGELQETVRENPTATLIGAGLLLGLFLMIFGGAFLGWWFTRYKITDEHVMVKSGVFVRQHRQARIDRVQSVDLRQPLLARLTGLAELKFEVAEGDATAVTLSFVRRSEAEELRSEIMDRAAGRNDRAADAAGHADGGPGAGLSEDGAPAPRPDAAAPQPGGGPERFIAKVPTGRLIGSIVLGPVVGVVVFITVLAAVAAGVITVIPALFGDADNPAGVWMVIVGGIGAVPFLIPVALGMVFTVWGQLNSSYGFTATMTDAGLRLRYGLTTTNAQTVPPGRVQGLSIRQPLLWRIPGWFQMNVTVAGYGLDARNQVLPVGTKDEVMAIAAEIFPDLQVDSPEELFLHGLTGSGEEAGFTAVPRRARIFDPLVRRRRGFFTTPSVLMLRDGWAARVLRMVPHERVQSLELSQGPLARRRDVVDLRVHLPSGPVLGQVKNQDLAAASELFEFEAAQAAVARRISDRNQWMQPEELAEFERMVEKIEAEQDEPRAD
ncbi:PH domain-containing protein [Nesterenkonia populi]